MQQKLLVGYGKTHCSPNHIFSMSHEQGQNPIINTWGVTKRWVNYKNHLIFLLVNLAPRLSFFKKKTNNVNLKPYPNRSFLLGVSVMWLACGHWHEFLYNMFRYVQYVLLLTGVCSSISNSKILIEGLLDIVWVDLL